MHNSFLVSTSGNKQQVASDQKITKQGAAAVKQRPAKSGHGQALRPIAALMLVAGIALFAWHGSAAVADPAQQEIVLAGSESDLPWYRSFTLRSSEIDEGAFLPLKKPDVEIRAASTWGVTIGLEEQSPVMVGTERMSAGAFYEISPTFRLGGELSFTAPGELRVSTPEDSILPVRPMDEEPVVRIESSIKF